MTNTPIGSRIRIAIWYALFPTTETNQNLILLEISGGGIAGLCLAISLSAHPHLVVDLYEATGQFKEIGAGVMIWSRTWRILELMGLANEFSKIAHAPPSGLQGRVQTDRRPILRPLTPSSPCQAIGFDFRRSDQEHEGFRFKSVEMPCELAFNWLITIS